MNHEEILDLLANIEVVPIDHLPEEFTAWALELSESELQSFIKNFTDDVTFFAETIALPLEQVGPSDDPTIRRKNEALAYYAVAAWKVYQLDFASQAQRNLSDAFEGGKCGIVPPPPMLVEAILCLDSRMS